MVSPWIFVAMPAKYSNASIAVTASIALESRIGLPALSDFELGELWPVRLHQLRQLHEQLGAGGAGLFLPSGISGDRGAHRRIDIFLVAFGEISDHLAVARIKRRERLAAGGGTNSPSRFYRPARTPRGVGAAARRAAADLAARRAAERAGRGLAGAALASDARPSRPRRHDRRCDA